MTITASMVKVLRDKTGAGMMDCKTALTESNGDMEAASDWLRKKGISRAEKKAGRIAAEGLVGVFSDQKSAVVVEVNSETDFVARNQDFQKLAADVSQIAMGVSSIDELTTANYLGTSMTVAEQVKESIATIGENLNLRRMEKVSVDDGTVATYVHNAVCNGLGKIGVIVALRSTGDTEKVSVFGRKVAMHIAATNPLALSSDELDQEVIAKERAVYSEQAIASGKPENIIEKVVDGRMRKFFEEVVLLQQAFVVNPDLTVEKAVEEEGKAIGAPIEIIKFVRFGLGEGIEKEESDFVAEVAAASNI